jgi:hypothetical protein
MEATGRLFCLLLAVNFREWAGAPLNDRKFFEKSVYGRVIIPFIQPKELALTDATIPKLAV